MRSTIENVLRRAVDLNLRFYGDLARLSVDYVRDLSSALRDVREPAAAAAPPPRVLVLEAASGETASGGFAITNHLATVVSTRVATTPFVDGNGHAPTIDLTFEPADVHLQPAEQILVVARAAVGDTLVPGVSYRGEFTVPDLGGAGIPVIVRRRRDAG
jgi:hypothetical protein